MLYHLLYPLKNYFFGFNLLNYITFRSASAAVLALVISLFLGPFIIRWLQRKQVVETIREETPDSHQAKAGTPSMGGLIILVSVLIPVEGQPGLPVIRWIYGGIILVGILVIGLLTYYLLRRRRT